MYTIETETEHDDAPAPARAGSRHPDRRWIVAAAAAVIVVGLLGLVLAFRAEDQPQDPADAPLPTTPAPTREDQALATATTFWAAVLDGDVDSVIAMSNPDVTDLEADREMWAMNALSIEHGEKRTIDSCTVTNTTDRAVDVSCTITTDDPLFGAFGHTELVNPARIYDDGSVEWMPMVGRPFAGPNRAVAEYLMAFDPEAYESDCDPTAYAPGSIVSDGGLALTLRCASVWVPLTDDIARWVEDDRPTP